MSVECETSILKSYEIGFKIVFKTTLVLKTVIYIFCRLNKFSICKDTYLNMVHV